MDSELCGQSRRWARLEVAGRGDPDAISQDALLGLLSLTGPPRDPCGWLRGTIRNLARMQLRGDRRRRARELATNVGDQTAPATLDVVAEQELRQRAVDALNQLDEPYRTTLRLRFLAELSTREIAQRTGVAEATVRVRSLRGLALLRERWPPGSPTRAERRNRPGGLLLAWLWTSGKAPTGRATRLGLATGAALAGGVLVAVATEPAVEPVVSSATASPHVSLATSRPRSERSQTPATRTLVSMTRQGPESTLHGRVRAADGTPLRSAIVSCYAEPFDRPLPGLAKSRRPLATSPVAADGTFRISVPVAGASSRQQQFGVLVEAEGYAPAWRDTRIGTDALELTCHRAASRAGRVLDVDGRPVAGVEVRYRSPHRVDGTVRFTHRRTTSADGRFAAIPIPAGRKTGLDLWRPGSAPQRCTVAPTADASQPLQLAWASEQPVALRVVDEESGRPIPADVVVGRFHHERIGRTKANGEFTLAIAVGIERQSAPDLLYARSPFETRHHTPTIAFAAPGYCLAHVPLYAIRGDRRHTIPLRRGATVRGNVHDEAQQPLADVAIRWAEVQRIDREPTDTRRKYPAEPEPVLYEPGVASRCTTSDSDGAFRLPSVPWDPSGDTTDTLLTARLGNRHGRITIPSDLDPSAPHTIEITVIRRDSTPRGRVVASGRPYPGIVTVSDRSGREIASVLADRDGTFRFAELSPGAYRVQARARGQMHDVPSSPPIDMIVSESATARFAPVALDIQCGFSTIDRRIVTADGRPVRGLVAAHFHDGRDRGKRAAMDFANAHGRIRLPVVTESTERFELVVTHAGYPWRCTVDLGSSSGPKPNRGPKSSRGSTAWRLPALVTREVGLIDSAGQPVAIDDHSAIKIEHEALRGAIAAATARGPARQGRTRRNLPTGACTLILTLGDGREAHTTADVRPGDDEPIVLRLTR